MLVISWLGFVLDLSWGGGRKQRSSLQILCLCVTFLHLRNVLCQVVDALLHPTPITGMVAISSLSGDRVLLCGAKGQPGAPARHLSKQKWQLANCSFNVLTLVNEARKATNKIFSRGACAQLRLQSGITAVWLVILDPVTIWQRDIKRISSGHVGSFHLCYKLFLSDLWHQDFIFWGNKIQYCFAI